jgi:hypothetical protein
MRFVLCALLLLLVAAPAFARIWTSVDSRTLEGEFVSATDAAVIIRRTDGRSITITLDKLSAADRAHVAEQRARKPPLPPVSGSTNPKADAENYIRAVAKINDDHAARPGSTTESELSQKLPESAATALRRLVAAKDSPELANLLVTVGEAALDLDRMEDFAAVRQRLGALSPDTVDTTLGSAVSRPRFLIRGIGKLDAAYLDNFAGMFDAILKAYDEVFGFKEFSKVPGKKLRVRVHLEEAIKRPPHFAPEFPWHSQIDFPVVDAAKFTSPTPQGQFLFYGLCHELGHVIAMWGDLKTMEDHHSWAHYTGVAIVEHLAAKNEDIAFLKESRDLRWRSLKVEREMPENKVPPSLKDGPGVMALLIALHDRVGSKAIGDALNELDAKGTGRRVNHVRYYSFVDLRKALLATLTDEAKRKTVTELLPH